MPVSEYDSKLDAHSVELASNCAKGRHGAESQNPQYWGTETKKAKNTDCCGKTGG